MEFLDLAFACLGQMTIRAIKRLFNLRLIVDYGGAQVIGFFVVLVASVLISSAFHLAPLAGND